MLRVPQTPVCVTIIKTSRRQRLTSQEPSVTPPLTAEYEDVLDFFLGLQLDQLVGFQNGLRSYMHQQFQTPAASDNKDEMNSPRLFDRMHAANGLLLLYSYLEEVLYLMVRNKAPNHLPSGGSSLDRFKRGLKAMGLDLSVAHWELFNDVYKLRNCLMHANGRISILRDVQDITTVIARHDDKLTIENDRLVVSPLFLQHVVNGIRAFRVQYRALN